MSKRDLDRDNGPSEGGTPPSKKTNKSDKPSELTSPCVSCNKSANKDSVECEFCHEWEHYQCAGITKSTYKALGNSAPNVMFFCSVCQPKLSLTLKFINEIKDKQRTIELKLQKLEEELKHISSNTIPQSIASSNQQSITTGIPLNVPFLAKQALPDRKCNIVVYGINEPAPKTEKQTRVKQDIKGVLTAFAPINDQLDPSAIKDCFRLGKYNTSHTRPRPLMVKFLRTIDATHILSNRKLLQSPVYVKPDLTQEERKTESLLLRERRVLIDKGIGRNRIKLRNSQLFLDNQPHCTVQNFQLQFNVPTPNNDNNTPMTVDHSVTSSPNSN